MKKAIKETNKELKKLAQDRVLSIGEDINKHIGGSSKELESSVTSLTQRLSNIIGNKLFTAKNMGVGH